MSTAGPSTSSGALALSAGQLAEVLRAVKDGMREEMSSLKRELAGDREAADECLLKKMRLEKSPIFKKKTHEKQFKFNEEVSCKIDSAKTGKKKSMRKPEHVSGVLGRTFVPFSNAASQLPLSTGTVPLMAQRQTAGYPAKWSGAAAAGPPLQGPCFNCGMVGHVRKFCLMLQVSVPGGK